MVQDFRDYPHSSYDTHLSESGTWLAKADMRKWFGCKDDYETAHLAYTKDHLSRSHFWFDQVD